MKLVTKVSLTAGIIFFLATQLLSGILLYGIWKDNVVMVTDVEQQRFDNVRKYFRQSVVDTKLDWDNELTKKTIIIQLFRQKETRNMALYKDAEELFNLTGYNFSISDVGSKKTPLKEEKTQQQVTQGVERQKIDGRVQLVYWAKERINKEQYTVYYMKDIHYITEHTRSIALWVMGISLGLSAVVMVLLVFLEKRILRPIYRLRAAAREIGQGNYEKRIPILRMDEIGEISQSFNEMADQVQHNMRKLSDTNERQKQLLGSLGHELRTPMTSIIGYADTLLRVKLAPEKKERALLYIRSECQRLSRLSKKLMDLNNLYGSDIVELRPIYPPKLLARVEESVHYVLEEAGIFLEVRISSDVKEIDMDSDLMESLLINLIDNARKASKAGNSILLEAKKNAFIVTDHGKGIPKEEIAKVTQAFYMADKSRAKQSGGVGLGLALCEQIARIHHAKLDISSEEGVGTVVSVVFEERSVED